MLWRFANHEQSETQSSCNVRSKDLAHQWNPHGLALGSSQKQDIRMMMDLLWNTGHFDMTNKNECYSLAYTIEQMKLQCSEGEYERLLEDWLHLIGRQSYNALGMFLAFQTACMITRDETFTAEEVLIVASKYDEIRDEFSSGKVKHFGILDENYAPEWFKEILPSYIAAKQGKLKKNN